MSQYVMFADLGEKVVITDAPEHPEPRPAPGAVARPWNACTIPCCTNGPCPAKLRAWASYGRRYMCEESDCDHRDCLPRRRAEDDRQPFGVGYVGPALPHPATLGLRSTMEPDGDSAPRRDEVRPEADAARRTS